MSQDGENRPIEKLRDGAIEVSIWETRTDKGMAYNTQRTRSYRDADGNWNTTHAIPERDLLRAARLDEMAYDSIQKLRQQDRLQNLKQERTSRAQDRGPER